MDYQNTSQHDKRAVLEHAVLTKSPEEIATLYKQLGEVEGSARALGLACRFRGLACVKALVENGANFSYMPYLDGSYYTVYYWLSPLEMNGTLRRASFIRHGDSCFTNHVTKEGKSLNVLPIEQRVEVVEYLYQCREQVCLDVGELLYYAIMSDSKRIINVLRNYGVKFSERRINNITENGRSYEWFEFCSMLETLGNKEYMQIVDSISKEIGGKPLHFTDLMYVISYKKMYNPEFFQFILDHFNQKKMNKSKLMKVAVDRNNVACLEICSKAGWLDMPRKRDEMIKYAAECGSTECSAWLLDFKNRTADFAAERKKEEQKMMRELNANPNSVTELKKIWGYEKREDGAIVITRYKGKSTEIEVPEKIGNSIVTEIGFRAFSTYAKRLTDEQIDVRENITRIMLPETIQAIGEGAFQDCTLLKEVNIPDGVTAIGANAFSGCASLASIELPEGITRIEEYTFFSCRSLESVTIPKTVEIVCRKAFYCCALKTVKILEGVAEIGPLAFSKCAELKSVELPSSLHKIKNYTRSGQTPQTVFHESDAVTAVVKPKSYAEKYCKRNQIPSVYEEE
ncbi:MAG: leucine-rich repeat domain-containing protein [Lachnospiraceae bacterium]|nr:leucine-rich repeat domain-containing protein [Lachnospiraceae bacterium]